MSYSMRLFALPYRAAVCVLPVLMYIAVYLIVCGCLLAFVSNILVSRLLCVCVWVCVSELL